MKDDEPLDVEFTEIGKANLPAVRPNVPATREKQFRYYNSEDKDLYPIPNHLWAVQDNNLYCLGRIVSYNPSTSEYKPYFNISGEFFPGRRLYDKVNLNLKCDDHQYQNLKAIVKVYTEFNHLMSKGDYIIHLLGVMINFSIYQNHAFLFKETLLEEYEVGYTHISSIEGVINVNITFTGSGINEFEVYTVNEQDYDINYSERLTELRIRNLPQY